MSTSKLPDRLRFSSFVLDRLANGRCRARVVLTWIDDVEYVGESEGLSSQAGELRCAAQACVECLAKAVGSSVRFELFGVKAVRAFDSTVVIVSLALSGETGAHRLVGCCLTEVDASRGAMNVFVVKNRELFTPAPHAGILKGITRDTVIELARAAGYPVHETILNRYDIYTADEAFLTGTAAEIAAISQLDGRVVGAGRQGPVTRDLSLRFQAYVRD